MKMFVTKYALTKGIYEEDGTVSVWQGTSYFRPHCSMAHLSVGTEARETRDQAIAAAESMRKRKIASLKRQIDKLKALRFE